MKTYKVVYNSCFGGFGLSKEAVRLAKQYASSDSPWHSVNEEYGFIRNVSRHDSVLVRVVEELGKAASGMCANLEIEEIHSPLYRIDDYDGLETVQTPDSLVWEIIQ